MAKITKIGKIEFNRHALQVGEVQSVGFEVFEIGVCDVASIADCQLIDKSFHRVFFSDGAYQDIFNVSRVYWIVVD